MTRANRPPNSQTALRPVPTAVARLSTKALVAISVVFATLAGPASQAADESYDVVISGGRVIDPESGLDRTTNVGIRDGKVARIAGRPLDGKVIVRARGLIVAPGFIDLHSHGQTLLGRELAVQDGVTTALDLELGAWPVEPFYETHAGRAPIHHGVSVGHIPARVKIKHGRDIVHPLTSPLSKTGPMALIERLVRRFFNPMEYAREPLDGSELEQMLELIGTGLDQGGIGIGMALDYIPGADDREIRAIFELAASRKVTVFVHMRGVAGVDDMSSFENVMGHARETGASLHLVHIVSSGQARTAAYLERIDAARERGMDVTTEAYPYTAGSTQLESAFFDEGWRERLGIDYGDVEWCLTGERLTPASFEQYRKEGGPVIIHFLTDEQVDTAMAHPQVMVASDAMPFLAGGEHPRGAGTFARALGLYGRERGLNSIMDAVAKMTWMPAKRLEEFVPAMRNKGRISIGADADITVFDPSKVRDRATYAAPREPSEGIVHVLVGGAFVVRDGELIGGALPGSGIRGGTSGADVRKSSPAAP